MFIPKNAVRVLFLLAAVGALATGSQPQPYDGVWWHSTNEEHHRGWLAGYIDCSVTNGKADLGFISWYTLEPKVTKFYASNPNDSKSPVAKVLYNIVIKSRTPKPGEKTQVHNGFDGEYWRQALPDHREGYVEGFLACHQELKGKEASFSKPASWYVAEISEWFGVKADDPGEINPKRENVAISTVLFKFKDAAQRSALRKATPSMAVHSFLH